MGFYCMFEKIEKNNHKLKSIKFQNGVMRTNCLDCLDRTNAVQMYFAFNVMLEQLAINIDINKLGLNISN